MKFQTPLCILFILGMTASCGLFRSEDIEPIPGTVRLETALQWNGENYAVGNVTADAFGHPFRLDNLQLYMAPVEFRSEDGEWVSSDDVFLIDYGEHGKNLVLPCPPEHTAPFGLVWESPPKSTPTLIPHLTPMTIRLVFWVPLVCFGRGHPDTSL